MPEPTASEVLDQLDSACRYLFPDRPPHKAFGMTKDLIESLHAKLADATKLIDEGTNAMDRLMDAETALRRIASLDEKNVPKYAQQIASEVLLKLQRGRG